MEQKRILIISGIIASVALVGSLIVFCLPGSSPTAQVPVDRNLKGLENHLEATKIVFDKKNEAKILTTGESAPRWGSVGAQVNTSDKLKAADKTKPNDKIAKKDAKKKKKKLAKKKKKKKTLEARKKSPDRKQAEVSEIAPNSDFIYTNAQIQKAKRKNVSPENRTVEDWQDYILNPPNVDRLMEFVQYHQAQIVTDQVFLGLSEIMYSPKQTEEVRGFGVIALTSYASSQSFLMLASGLPEETNPELQNRVTGNFLDYQALTYVSMLRVPMTSQSTSAKFYALTNLVESARANIKPVLASSNQRGRGSNGKVSSKAVYQGFLATLDNMRRNESDDNIRRMASDAFFEIDGLLKNANLIASQTVEL